MPVDDYQLSPSNDLAFTYQLLSFRPSCDAVLVFRFIAMSGDGYLGNHYLNCGGHGDIIARHDRLPHDELPHAIHDKSASASLAPRKEQKDLSPGSRFKPGEIFIPSWKSGKPAAFDVTVTCSLQASVILHAAATIGYALKQAEEKKLSKHSQGCEDQGITFIAQL